MAFPRSPPPPPFSGLLIKGSPSSRSSSTTTSNSHTHRRNYQLLRRSLPLIATAGNHLEAMDARVLGMEIPLFTALHHLMDIPADEMDKSSNAPTRTYVRDARAMAATPADVKELPGSYAFVVDMSGLKSGDIKVQVEDDNVLVISGARRREEDDDKEGKYLRMERRAGKFMRNFSLPDNANADAISALYRDGVLTVTVEKLPLPPPKKPKTVE